MKSLTMPARPATADELAASFPPLPTWRADSDDDLPFASEFVDGLLARGGLSVLFGESGCGKTFLALDLACRVALGWPWLGRTTERGPVLYLAAESCGSVTRRVRAFQRHHDVPNLPLDVVIEPADIRSVGGETLNLVGTVQAVARERGAPVTLVIVDTLSRSFGGGSENDSADMGSFVANLDLVRHDTGAHVLVVHHVGKDATKGARGHSLLRAAVDVEIAVERRESIVVATIAKSRDGESGGELAARLVVMDAGVKPNGQPLTTCIVEPAEGTPARPAGRPARRLSTYAANALDALRKALADHGRPLPETSAIPPGRRGVLIEQWRAAYYLMDRLDVESDSATEREREAESRKKRFQRARADLRAAGLVGIVNEFAWAER